MTKGKKPEEPAKREKSKELNRKATPSKEPELESSTEDELKRVLTKGEKAPTKELVRIIQQIGFSGPLPPPQILKGYNGILPGAAERIMCMAERQAQHRQEIESDTLNAEIRDGRRGQLFGFIIAMTAVLGAIYCFSMGYTTGGSIIGLSTVTGLVSVFVYGRREKRKETEAKIKLEQD